MVKRTGEALRFMAFFVASKVGKTGLTVTVDVYRDGTQIVTAGSATAVGGGLYVYVLSGASTGTAGFYAAVFKTADSTVDAQHIPSGYDVGSTIAAGVVDMADDSVSAAAVSAAATTKIANEVEAQIIDDTDSEKVLEAIVNKINAMTDLDALTLAAIAAAVRSSMETELGRIDVAISTRLSAAGYTVPPTAAAVADAVWDEARAGHATAGTYGATAEWAGVSSLTAGDVWAYVNRSLTVVPGSGTGARTVIVHVQDEDDAAIVGAQVRLTGGPTSTAAILTDASGNATFAVNDGTYNRPVTASNYFGSNGTIVVDDNETVTVTLTAIAESTPPTGSITARFYTVSDGGVIQGNKVVYWQLVKPDADGTGRAFEYGDPNQVTSDANGLVEISLVPGCTIERWRRSDRKRRNLIPLDATSPRILEDV